MSRVAGLKKMLHKSLLEERDQEIARLNRALAEADRTITDLREAFDKEEAAAVESDRALAEETALRERLSSLLRRTADALKGPPEPLHLHDWSDLPEVAASLRAQLSELSRRETEYVSAVNLWERRAAAAEAKVAKLMPLGKLVRLSVDQTAWRGKGRDGLTGPEREGLELYERLADALAAGTSGEEG